MIYTPLEHAKIRHSESLLEWFKQTDWLRKTNTVKCQTMKVTI